MQITEKIRYSCIKNIDLLSINGFTGKNSGTKTQSGEK